MRQPKDGQDSEIKQKMDSLLSPLLGSISTGNRNTVTKEYINILRTELNAYHKAGLGGYDFAVLFSDFIDKLIKMLSDISDSGPTNACAIIAIGGYGRAELNAYSDIDLLFLYNDTLSEGFQNNILYPLWDTKLEIGHSSRTVEECIDDALDDHTVLTSLMDQRYIAGSHRLYLELYGRFYAMVRGAAPRLFHERETEILSRREKYSTSVYMLEPNIKECPGGLRDVHNMLWLTRLFSDIADIRELGHSPFLDTETYGRFISNYNILMRLRNEMHFLSGSKNDRLTFEVQKHLSSFSGYENEEDVLGVEKFLSNFYEITHQVLELADDYIRCLRDAYIATGSGEKTEEIAGYYRIGHKQLLLRSEGMDVYSVHPEEIVRTFRILADYDLRPAVSLKNAIRREMAVLKPDVLLTTVFPAFLGLFEGDKLSKALYLMNDCGVLGMLIDEFKGIAYRVQYDMYHIYTVGVHSIKTVEEIEKIRDGDDNKFLQSLYRQVKSKKVLMLAAFLHDIGKGHGKDHARKGGDLAYGIAARLGMQQPDADLVAFLVRNHLVLSDTAQRRDINDEKLVYEFSKLIKRRENLKMLYLLTVADLRAVSSSVWTEWKGGLINELYKRSEEALEQGLDMARLTTEKYHNAKEEIKRLLRERVEPSIIEEFLDGFNARYFTTYSPQEIVGHFDLMNRYKMDGTVSVSRAVNPQLGYTKISVCTTDKPGIFSTIAGVLSANSANIMDANITIRKDGVIVDVFRVEDKDTMHPYADYKFQRFADELKECLLGRISVESLLSARFKPSILKDKVINTQPTEITVNEDVSDIYTLLEIYTQDRQRLLYDMTSTISRLNLNIVIAKITTRVDQVADIFYVEKIGGGKIANAQDAQTLTEALRSAIEKEAH
ncbi:MAG: [protein-PII] uridylyltransferase [Deltaproteobacteria bacterium]|nr:[protein-PII] uridylyltransferase [Deltaproteobacteria bacterium]MCL5276933.1 [protein-PII] uridylyltransferase [Deltaproteobacteria bacterium]